jgi:hypothetical protein
VSRDVTVLGSAAEAVWCAHAPTRDEVARSPRPVFLASAIRPNTIVAARRALTHPVATASALARGTTLRALLSFMLFRETIECFGVERVVEPSGGISPLDAFLSRRDATRRPAPPRRAPDIGCVVIAQNEEDRLGTALASVEPYVKEIIVVDGGSTDATVDVARRFGATVVERTFDRDFAAQQNAGLTRVRSPWTLVIDADETLEPELGALLVDIVSTIDVDAVYVPFLNFIEEHGNDLFQWPDVHPRLFRTGLLYEGAVHAELARHRRAVHTPLSGPYMVHRKDLLRQHRASLLYSTIDPSPYTPEYLAWVRDEITRLEADHR